MLQNIRIFHLCCIWFPFEIVLSPSNISLSCCLDPMKDTYRERAGEEHTTKIGFQNSNDISHEILFDFHLIRSVAYDYILLKWSRYSLPMAVLLFAFILIDLICYSRLKWNGAKMFAFFFLFTSLWDLHASKWKNDHRNSEWWKPKRIKSQAIRTVAQETKKNKAQIRTWMCWNLLCCRL